MPINGGSTGEIGSNFAVCAANAELHKSSRLVEAAPASSQ
jgi:hypothetical protein